MMETLHTPTELMIKPLINANEMEKGSSTYSGDSYASSAVWSIFASTYSWIPLFSAGCLPSMSLTVPHVLGTSPLLKRMADATSPKGSAQFVCTVIGPKSSGKSTMCHQLKKELSDVTDRKFFRRCPMPPELQVSLTIQNDTFNIGLYDSVGFADPELLIYTLKGQKKESPSQDDLADHSIEEPELPMTPRTKQKTIASEVFVVMFDLTSQESFDQACILIDAIFEYFKLEPDVKSRCPLVIYLVGNKLDLPNRISGYLITHYLSQKAGWVLYHEMSSLTDQSSLPMVKSICYKLKEKRCARTPSFWD